MRNLVFTVAFGAHKYMQMAKALELSIKKYSPDVEFKIFSDGDFTPFEEGLPKGRELFPKDYKYPKIEIMTRLNDPDTRYMFIDADCFIFGDLTPYFDMIEPGKLIIEHVYRGDEGWAGNKDLQFHKACEKVGLKGIKPYSVNSGFIMWQGGMPCFDKALELIKTVTIQDSKGVKGDEYYYCAGIQLANTDVIPLDYDKIHLGKFWNGKIGFDGERLTCSAYPKNDRIIQHYGNHNFDNPHVKRILRQYGVWGYDPTGWIRYKKFQSKEFIKKLINR